MSRKRPARFWLYPEVATLTPPRLRWVLTPTQAEDAHMKSLLALLILAAALFVGACNNSTGGTTAPTTNPVSSPVTSPEMSPEASPS